MSDTDADDGDPEEGSSMTSRWLLIVGLALAAVGVAVLVIGIAYVLLTQPPKESSAGFKGCRSTSHQHVQCWRNITVPPPDAGEPAAKGLDNATLQVAFPSSVGSSDTRSVWVWVWLNKRLSVPRAVATQFSILVAPVLNAVGFDTAPAGVDWQPLSRTPTQWLWEIRPQSTGNHYVFVSLNVQWQPIGKRTSATVKVMQRRIWEQGQPYLIDIDDPRFVKGSINFLSIAAAFLTSAGGVLISVLFSRLADRKSDRAEDKSP